MISDIKPVWNGNYCNVENTNDLYYQVTYYIRDQYETQIVFINDDDLNDFHRGKLDFLIGLVDDGERFSINGAMIYTIKQVYR